MLHDICNMDKHRHLVIANARWTGEWLKFVNLASFHPMPKLDERSYLEPGPSNDSEIISYELQSGQTLVVTTGFRDWQYLAFPVDAFFVDLEYLSANTRKKISVSEMLDACIDSVEIAVARLREEF